MNQLLPKVPTGNGALQRWLEWLKSAVQSSRIIDSPDIAASVTSQGTYLTVKNRAAGGAGSTLKQYRLKSIQGDFLTCRTWDGTTEGTEDIHIARDPELRRSPFEDAGTTGIAYDSDGDAFTATFVYTSNTKRTKTVAGVAEVQVIVPYYKTDFTIILAAESANKTGVTGPDEEDIYLVELTQRAWAKLDS